MLDTCTVGSTERFQCYVKPTSQTVAIVDPLERHLLAGWRFQVYQGSSAINFNLSLLGKRKNIERNPSKVTFILFILSDTVYVYRPVFHLKFPQLVLGVNVD